MKRFCVYYTSSVFIDAENKEEAEKIAMDTRKCIGFDRPIKIGVKDDTLVVALDKVVDWSDIGE